MVFVGRGEEPVSVTCTILRLDPPVLLEHTHPANNSTMRWELRATEDGCLLRLSHTVSDIPGAIENCYVVGLHTSLSRLVPAIAGNPVPWDWDEFATSQAHYASVGLAAPVDEADQS